MNVSHTSTAQLRAFAFRVLAFVLTLSLLPSSWYTTSAATVSYTHLDVYKRQRNGFPSI